MKNIVNILLCVATLVLASCIGDGGVKDDGNNIPSDEKGVLMLNVATRTEGGVAMRDYTLCIYKNEAGASTLVRKYDSSKEEMQKPEYIWLLAGNYTAKVESGKSVSATFDESEKYFIGETSFDIVAGNSLTVDLVAVMQNIPVEVLFDQTVIDGFHDGYYAEVKASNSAKLRYTESKKGYFVMPQGVTTLSWSFVGTYEYASGEQVSVNKSGTIENVAVKHGYKLAFKYSKDAPGFLGGLEVVVDESVEERDDHLAFNPDPQIAGDGFDMNVRINYSTGDRRYVVTSPSDMSIVKLMADGKVFDPIADTVAGVAIEGLNTSLLYVTLSDDFFNGLMGGEQNIELYIEDIAGGATTKELPYNLQGVNIYDNSNEHLAWSGGTTNLSATIFTTPQSVQIVYREGDQEWKAFDAVASGENTYTAQISGIDANHTYEYNLILDGKTIGTPRTFTTRDGNQIPNGGLDDWCTNSDGVVIPYSTPDNAYWCTGNYGTEDYVGNITNLSYEVRPGTKGKRSASLKSVYAVVKFAAGNIYVGSWGGMNGMNATVYFGQPFEFNAKPRAFRFWAKFNCGIIDKVSGKVGKEGDPDLIKIFCCMATESHKVDSGDASGTTFSPSDANIKSGDARYNKVLYSAYFETTQSQEEWKQFEVPFTFYGTDPNQVPTHLIVTFTCSGYGDFFDGSTKSTMYIDDIELVY